MTWHKVVMLLLYVVGALTALAIDAQAGEAIAYMLAGAAANQGAQVGPHSPSRSKRDTLRH